MHVHRPRKLSSSPALFITRPAPTVMSFFLSKIYRTVCSFSVKKHVPSLLISSTVNQFRNSMSMYRRKRQGQRPLQHPQVCHASLIQYLPTTCARVARLSCALFQVSTNLIYKNISMIPTLLRKRILYELECQRRAASSHDLEWLHVCASSSVLLRFVLL